MTEKYQKISYDQHPAFNLHHTFGNDAGGSTLGFLHTNKMPMLIFFRKGSGVMKVEGHHYDIKEGDAVILNPNEVYICSVNEGGYHERIVLYVKDSFLKETAYDDSGLFRPFWERCRGVGNHIPAAVIREHHIDSLLSELLDSAKNLDAMGRLLSLSKLIELLVKLNTLFLPDVEMSLNTGKENSHVHRVISYLDKHYREIDSVDHIATEFGLNKSYLSHLFKEYVGMSLWNYVVLRRLHGFNALIRNGSSVEESCWQVGFQNYSNFYRLYKKYMGITPVQYKQQTRTWLES